MIAALTAIHEYVSERNHSTCVELEGRRYTLQPCGVRKYDLAAKGAGPDGGRVYAPHTVQAPKANAIAERFVRTVRSECLDWLLILNRRHLEHMLRTFVYHYNSHRPHRSLDLAPPEPSDGNLRALRPPTASLTLVAQGWAVAGAARSDETLAAVTAAGALALRSDITDQAAVRATVEEAARAHGGVDLVVNAAAAYGGTRTGPFGGGPIADAAADAFSHLGRIGHLTRARRVSGMSVFPTCLMLVPKALIIGFVPKQGERRQVMRRFAVILVVVLAGVAAGAGVGQGAAPVQLKGIAFSDSFTITGLCAFDVTVTVRGNASVTLWLNKAGKVVREHDTTPGATFTYSGNGNSFSFPSAVSIWTDYGGGGATLGGSATLKLSGMFGHAPGVISSDAGQQVIVGATVIDFDTANGGIPITNGGTIEAEHGHFNSGEAIDAAICAALS